MASKLDELQQKINALQKERDDLLAKEKASAIEQINSMIQAFGITADDLDIEYEAPSRFTRPMRAKVAMKYKSGNNAWSGRGRKPKWVEDHLAKGGKLDELLVK